MSARELTREQVIAWREAWSGADRRLIEEHLDRVGARTFDLRPSGGVVRCRDGQGRPVMYIAPGYVEFAPGSEPDHIAKGHWRGVGLSIFKPWSGSAAKPEGTDRYCPVHGYPLLPSGLCDTCEEELS